MEIQKRKINANGDEVIITLPHMDEIINGNTDGFLVMIAKNKSNVVMPKYFDFIRKNLETQFGEIGKTK